MYWSSLETIRAYLAFLLELTYFTYKRWFHGYCQETVLIQFCMVCKVFPRGCIPLVITQIIFCQIILNKLIWMKESIGTKHPEKLFHLTCHWQIILNKLIWMKESIGTKHPEKLFHLTCHWQIILNKLIWMKESNGTKHPEKLFLPDMLSLANYPQQAYLNERQ